MMFNKALAFITVVRVQPDEWIWPKALKRLELKPTDFSGFRIFAFL